MIKDKVRDSFQSTYGSAPQYMVRAPGRANLIGEHTDYNDGFVMPLAVDRALWIAFSRRDDAQMQVQSLDFGGETVSFSLNQLEDGSLPHWTKHIRGGWWLLDNKGFQVPGANIVMGGDIPLASGMSSSAAIGVGVIEMALQLIGETKMQAEKALLAVEIEHQFIGVPCGIMDQMASAAAVDHAAMLLDCRSLVIEPVHIPDGVSVVVMNTMKERELASSAYAQRRRECEEAAEILELTALRDATMAQVMENKSRLGDIRFRRSRHVVSENARTLDMQRTLEAGDLQIAGELINASHTSLRDDYEVSCFELDMMSEIGQSHEACYGARMMGGGFGGCAVALVQEAAVNDFVAYVEPRYREKTGYNPAFYVCKPAPGSYVEKID